MADTIRHPSDKNKRPARSMTGYKRWQVYVRDRFTCQHCHVIIPPRGPHNRNSALRGNTYVNRKGQTKTLFLEVDHIAPIHHGGTNDLSNLQSLCSLCNARKGAKVSTA